MTYKEARVYLDEMSKYGSVLGLDTIRGLLRELGNPQDDLKFIHIAGTNGKGSVLAYTSTILSEAGYRIGRYVSPTVVSYLERIQVDAEWISREDFAYLTEKVRDAIARLKAAGDPLPTIFETETAIAFLYFRQKQCDLVVLETGLGGALDATNIVKNTVCAVFTSVSRDHLGVIGNTVTEIAETKAGIIKPGCAVISSRQAEPISEILRKRAMASGCTYTEARPQQLTIKREDYRGMYFSYKEFRDMHTTIGGKNQQDNVSTSLETVRALRARGYGIPDEAVKKGLELTSWPGRFTCIGEAPVFILDGAHNEDAARRLRESVETYFNGKKLIGIMGVFRDKEYEKMAQIMGPLFSEIYAVDLPDRKRGLPSEILAETLGRYCSGVKRDNVENAVSSALNTADGGDVLLAFGSLSYLHQVKEVYDRIVRE